jgi:hypothetical protein
MVKLLPKSSMDPAMTDVTGELGPPGESGAYGFASNNCGLGDVVGGLHPHERGHLHSKGVLNAERRIPGKVSLAVK